MPVGTNENELLIRCSHCCGLQHCVLLVRHQPDEADDDGSHDWHLHANAECQDGMVISADDMAKVVSFIQERSSKK